MRISESHPCSTGETKLTYSREEEAVQKFIDKGVRLQLQNSRESQQLCNRT